MTHTMLTDRDLPIKFAVCYNAAVTVGSAGFHLNCEIGYGLARAKQRALNIVNTPPADINKSSLSIIPYNHNWAQGSDYIIKPGVDVYWRRQVSGPCHDGESVVCTRQWYSSQYLCHDKIHVREAVDMFNSTRDYDKMLINKNLFSNRSGAYGAITLHARVDATFPVTE